MFPALLLAAAVACGAQPVSENPIRVGNAWFDPLDLSVSYDFVNEVSDVTAYEVSVTRYFADGSTLVSLQGQDWFSSTGYAVVSGAGYSLFCSWLPRYLAETPGRDVHLLSGPHPRAALIDADVKLTAVIRLDGTAVGSQRVIERLFSQRVAMLKEYAYWVPRFQRARVSDDPQAALAGTVDALSIPRRNEILSEPRECLLRAAILMQRLSENDVIDASAALEAIIRTATQQYELLVEQSVWRGTAIATP